MSSCKKPSLVILDKLIISNFRNIQHMSLNLAKETNLFIGENGQGKTNCLEAIALALSVRPLQTLKNEDLIKYAEPQAFIHAHFLGPHPLALDLDILPLGKKATINNQRIKSSLTLQKHVMLVSFIPAELAMIQSTSLRRRALDQAAWSLFFEHGHALKSYDKCLLHRNKLLKSWPIDYRALKVFSELLIKEGSAIMFFRQKTIALLQDLFGQKIKDILGHNNAATLAYMSQDRLIENQTITDLQGFLSESLDEKSAHEINRKVTLCGPHLDDVAFLLNGFNAQKTASRGQSRALVLAFKLAHMLAVEQMRGTAPIVILDDIVSELDEHTKANLFDAIADLNTQSFYSATDMESLGEKFIHAHRFLIRDGALVG